MVDTQRIIGFRYDPLYGRDVRDLKATDIVNTSGRVTGTVASTSVCSIVVGSNLVMYPYHWRVSVDTSTVTTFALIVDSTTVAYLTTGGTLGLFGEEMKGSIESPIGKVSASSTLMVLAISASAGVTYTSQIVSNREPLLTKIETQVE
jgi:hypothetical protein